MRDGRDDDLLRAIKACARIAGYALKRVAWTDDLKNRVLTIQLSGSSAGWVQETLDFEQEGNVIADPSEPPPGLEVTVDGEEHVEKVELVGRGNIDGEPTTITRHTPEDDEDPAAPYQIDADQEAALRGEQVYDPHPGRRR